MGLQEVLVVGTAILVVGATENTLHFCFGLTLGIKCLLQRRQCGAASSFEIQCILKGRCGLGILCCFLS